MGPEHPAPAPGDAPDDARREVGRRARLLKPGGGLGFLPLPDDRLIEFGLPPKPDERADPQSFRLWRRMLSEPLNLPEAAFGFQARARHRFLRAGPPAGADGGLAHGTPRTGGSRNWSGALILARNGLRFTSVWGNWRVPTPRMPEGAHPSKPPPGNQYQCSTWIGLDGHRRHSTSLPQVGTTHALVLGADGVWRQHLSAWHQWWIRGQNFPFVTLEGFALEPEDEVIATLTVVHPTRVHFTIKNQTKGDLVPISWNADSPAAPVEGSAAEWIVERPTDLDDEAILYELPDYGSVTFTNCVAAMGGLPRTLEAARLVRMHNPSRDPWRSGVVSLPDWMAPDHRSFRVVHRGPA